MGRTNPTYRDTLGGLEELWSDFWRWLGDHDQQHRDEPEHLSGIFAAKTDG